jgi:hypothetical protein
MVHNVTITESEWKNASINKNILENRNIFINYLINTFITDFKKIEDCDRTYVTLPTIVTKAERHSIHKMTSSWLNSYSYNNDNGDRYMIVDLSMRLIIDWVNHTEYQFPPEPVPVEEEFEVDARYEDNVFGDKEQEFNVLMKIILAHYPEELKKWNANQ